MAPSPQVRHAHHVQGRSCRPPGDIALLRQQLDDIPMRLQDKDSPWPVPYDQLFDQYVDAELLDFSSDNTGEATSSDDLGNFFDVSSSNGSAAAKTSPMPHWEPSRHPEPEDAWQQAWSVASAAPEGNQTSILPHSRGKAADAASELFSLDAPPSCSPQVPSDPFVFSAPASPRPVLSSCEAKKFNSLPIRGSKRQTPSVIRKSASKGSFSPKMMRSTPYRTSYQDIWAKRVGAPPLSPPPSSKVSQEESQYGYNFSSNMPFTTSAEVVDIERQLSYPTYSTRSPVEMTPVASPTTQDTSSARSSFQAPNDPRHNPYLTHDLNEALQTPPPQSSRLPSSSWSQNAPVAFDFGGGFSASSDYPQDREAQPWWTTTSVSQPSQHTAYHNGRSDFLAVSSAPSDLATNGLMIQCEPSSMNSMLDAHAPDASSFSTSSPVGYPSQMYTPTAMPPTPTFTHHHPHQPAPHPHPAAQQQQHLIHPHITPPSRSPTSSPTQSQPSSMQQPVFLARSRRDSSQPLPAPSSRSRSHHRRKSSSHSHHGHHHHNSTSSTGHSVAARPSSVGFVNYTPDDSRKILTGVAPSGSSKTKARREKEAADKRRRLSQAAARAIIEAGGDLAALEREGLLCLPEAQEMLAARKNA